MRTNILRQKHFHNRITPIGIIMVFTLNNCSSFLQQRDDTAYPQKINIIDRVNEYKVCRGKGKLISSGMVQGRLSFYFTCIDDEVYIHFKDFMGRNAMLMIIDTQSVEAWDILQNIRFSTESIYIRFPFFEFVSPQDLVSIFWGVEPDYSLKNKMNKSSSFHVAFSNEKFILDAVHLDITTESQTIDITFSEREYGSAYPHLVKPIPNTIPQAKS